MKLRDLLDSFSVSYDKDATDNLDADVIVVFVNHMEDKEARGIDDIRFHTNHLDKSEFVIECD